jgi:pilus assembly protein CpaE
MKYLIGMNKGSTLEGLMTYQTGGAMVEITNSKEQFLFRLQDSYNSVVVHTHIFADEYPWVWMGEIERIQKSSKVIIVLDETVYDSLMCEVIQRIASDFGFIVVPLGNTEDEISKELAILLFGKVNDKNEPKRGGKVVVTWSAASNDGSTTVAINTAIALATMTKLRIGLIDLNLKNPEIRANLNIPVSDKTNVKIRAKLQTNSLKQSDLIDACVSYQKIPGLFFLPGTPRRDTASDVTPEMVQHLLQVARETFDITIVDVHSFPDNAATISAVRTADERWLVVQDNYASYKTSWGEWYDCYWKHCKISTEDISLIVNRSTPQVNTDKIASQLNMKLLGDIYNVGGGLGVKAVHEGLPMYMQSTAKDFIQNINKLARTLIGEDESKLLETMPQHKSGWWSRLVATIS